MSAIGNTPLIKLTKLTPPGSAAIYVKYEGGNPTGSSERRNGPPDFRKDFFNT